MLGDSTCWTIIVRAQGSGPEARLALDALIRRYERAVLVDIRRLGRLWNRTPPEDLKQEFFLQLLRRDDVGKLDRSRGQFRGWLCTAVRHFMRNQREKHFAQYNPDSKTDSAPVQLAEESTPEAVFMRQFAEDTLLFALQKHRAEARDVAHFDALARFLPGPQLDLAQLGPIAAKLGIPRNRLAVQIHLLRDKHKRVLREVVADTLDVDPSDAAGAAAVELELQALHDALRHVPRRYAVPETA